MNLARTDMLRHYCIVYLEKLTKYEGLNNFFVEILYIASVTFYKTKEIFFLSNN